MPRFPVRAFPLNIYIKSVFFSHSLFPSSCPSLPRELRSSILKVDKKESKKKRIAKIRIDQLEKKTKTKTKTKTTNFL